jgi:tetrameric-type glycyl-tRNA synthetase alpha subunit
MQDLYLGSLEAIGLDLRTHDIRFVEDDWENPTVGAWGLGWEVWCDGMEVSQYTYFQQVGGLDVSPVAGELTYGLERLAMYVFGVDNVYDLPFNDPDSPLGATTYGDVFLENERQQSEANFHGYDVAVLKQPVRGHGTQVPLMLARSYQGKALVLPAYDMVLKASHLFNLMNARGAIAVAERASYIGRIRDLCKMCANEWVEAAGSRVSQMPQLLLELFSEEIPARMQAGAARDLERMAREHLAAAGFLPEALKTFAGPRRLTLVVEGLPIAQADRKEELKGPRVGAPPQAMEGFLRKAGLTQDQLVERDGVYMAFIEKKGRPTPRSSPRWSRPSCAASRGPSR